MLFVMLSLWVYQQKKSTSFYLGVLSLGLITAVLLITLLVLVPIDNDIKGWTAATVPADFAEIRNTGNPIMPFALFFPWQVS
jgi:ABC-type uncharacterized transport system permease subunit